MAGQKTGTNVGVAAAIAACLLFGPANTFAAGGNVPEPDILALVGLGLLGIGLIRYLTH